MGPLVQAAELSETRSNMAPDGKTVVLRSGSIRRRAIKRLQQRTGNRIDKLRRPTGAIAKRGDREASLASQGHQAIARGPHLERRQPPPVQPPIREVPPLGLCFLNSECVAQRPPPQLSAAMFTAYPFGRPKDKSFGSRWIAHPARLEVSAKRIELGTAEFIRK